MSEAGTQSALDLSDEDFLNMNPNDLLDAVESQEEELSADHDANLDEFSEAVATATESDDEEDVESSDSEAQEQPELEIEDDEVSQPDEDTLTEHETESDIDEPESLDTSDSDQLDTDGDTQETDEFDYKSAYEKVTSPFKANGTTMTVDDPEDVIRLMQMGANYQKKMQQLKPNLRLMKMLENQGLLDEAKLNNLIDISKKDPAAIAKLIKESGIDPLDIDTDREVEYTPKSYQVSDKEVALDQALEDIKDSETFDKTIHVLSKEWDNESKNIISDNPEIIGIIDMHMQNGVYDAVNEVLQREKTLGRLNGIPDIVAYRQAAEYLASTGNLVNPSAPQPAEPRIPNPNVSSDKTAKSAQLKQKRKAAATTKKTSSSTEPPTEDFLGLSDDEFMKKFA